MARILLAEDDGATRELLSRGLAADGHAVTAVEDGGAAAAALEGGQFDVLVTDVDMPVLDGVSLAVRAIARQPALKVLLMSGFTGALERADALKGVSIRVAPKPLSIADARAHVRTLLAA